MNLNKYLDTSFPNLKLQKPLFYSWSNGLRFEIGPESMPTMRDAEKSILNLEYFKEALDRAVKLFEYTFNKDDKIILVCQRYARNKQKIKKRSFCLHAINNLKLKKMESFKLRNLYPEDEYNTKKEHWHRVAVHLKRDEMDYIRILKRLTLFDFGANGPEVYFINQTKNLIFNLYDDRGLDIIASEKKDLKNIYQKFNNWILDYDRKKIDALFR
jgi:hypothetical protein